MVAQKELLTTAECCTPVASGCTTLGRSWTAVDPQMGGGTRGPTVLLGVTMLACSRPATRTPSVEAAAPCDTVLVADTTLGGISNAWINAAAVTSWARARGAPAFTDYSVPATFHGRPARPRLTSPSLRRFRTVLRTAAAEGPNFAGHYTIAMWGCGSPCVSLAVIDAVNGSVTFVSNPSARPPMFSRESRLVVFDDASYLTDSLGRPKFGNVAYFAWTGHRLDSLLVLKTDSVRVPPSSYGVPETVTLHAIPGAPPDVQCWER
jgi:hypothetical protein